MGFQIRQSRPTTLQEAMEAAQNYENSAQSLRKALRRDKHPATRSRKQIRKSRRRSRHSGSEDSSSGSGSSSHSSGSGESEDQSPSPRKSSHTRKVRTEPERTRAKVKVEVPDKSDANQMMKDIHEALVAIKVNLAENRKPRRMLPTTRSNVWCTKCGE